MIKIDQTDERTHRIRYFIDSRAISGLNILHRLINIRGVPVSVGGIGGVWTNADYRRQGYSRRVIEEALDFMKNYGFDISLLFGIPDFYHRFGYIPLVPDGDTYFAAAAAAAVPEAYTCSELPKSEYRDTLAVYTAGNRLRTGSFIREASSWDNFRPITGSSHRMLVLAVRDSIGLLQGYTVCHLSPEEVIISETGALDEALYPAMLGRAAAMALERGLAQVRMLMPLDHPCMDFARRCGCRAAITWHASQGCMGRIINLLPLFERLKAILDSSALQGAARHGLLINAGLGTVRLYPGKGAVEVDDGQADVQPDMKMPVVELPQELLMQLIMGSRSAGSVLAETGAAADHREMVATVLAGLFPCNPPFIWNSDRF